MSEQTDSLLTSLQALAEIVEKSQNEPFGPPAGGELRLVAGEACKTLCGGDNDKARALWRQIGLDLDGYMPTAAAVALMRAVGTINLVPDIEAPVVS